MKINMPESITNAMSLTPRCFFNRKLRVYQIRAQRAGRGRLVTIKALGKNRYVLGAGLAAMAANKWVNNVFNFF
jgi:hypothetical protein